jgi:hypothetical protein
MVALAETSTAKTIVVALFSSGGLAVISQVVVWVINRGASKKKDMRDDSAAERADEESDITILRNISNDALARERYAYEQLRAEQQRNETIQRIAEEERRLRVTAEQQLATCMEERKQAQDDAVYSNQQVVRLERYIAMLEKRQTEDAGTPGGVE